MTWLKIRVGLKWNITLTLLLTCLLAMWHIFTITQVTQVTIELHAYFNQVADLAFKALKACTCQESSAYFRNAVQQFGDSFTDFLSLEM